jgi:hypothetical protein
LVRLRYTPRQVQQEPQQQQHHQQLQLVVADAAMLL